jgi:hypothetical protein
MIIQEVRVAEVRQAMAAATITGLVQVLLHNQTTTGVLNLWQQLATLLLMVMLQPGVTTKPLRVEINQPLLGIKLSLLPPQEDGEPLKYRTHRWQTLGAHRPIQATLEVGISQPGFSGDNDA